MKQVPTMAAEAWFARLRSPTCTAGERAAFDRWYADPDAARAYDEVVAIWEAAGSIAERPAVRALRQEMLQATGTRLLRRRLVGSAAAAAAALAFFLLLQPFKKPDMAFATAVGEQKVITLDDGSSVTLDTASQLRVRFTGKLREVVLDKGQAFFDVAHAPDRPFIVVAGEGKVTAIGTAFAVRRYAEEVTVTLASGAVAVTPSSVQKGDGAGAVASALLKPNEQIAYGAKGLTDVHAVDVSTSLSWARGDIIFRHTPLSDAVAEINRYTTTRLAVRDPAIAALQINGVFHIADVETFLLVLDSVFGVTTDGATSGNELLLIKKNAPFSRKN